MTPHERLIDLLDASGIAYRTLRHEPTRTSEESAAVRGEPLKNGAKALVLKVDDTFRLFVLSAARRLDAGAIRRHFGARRSRFATADELMKMTGLVPGSVPPFGRPILDLDAFVDPSVLERERIAFNAGSLIDSVIMAAADYARAATFESFVFSRESDETGVAG